MRAFTLIEVVIALGIFSFAGIALLGLFLIGLQDSQRSVNELRVSGIAQTILATRMAAPTNALGTTFPLPVLNVTNALNLSTPVLIAEDGTVATNSAAARYGLLYSITPTSDPGARAVIYLCLYWPAQATSSNAAGHYETTVSCALP